MFKSMDDMPVLQLLMKLYRQTPLVGQELEDCNGVGNLGSIMQTNERSVREEQIVKKTCCLD